jgi:hypothetical protein
MENILIEKVESLPEEAQYEISNFLEFILETRGKDFVRPTPTPGLGKNIFSYVALDFDAPLDDFKE